MATSSFSFRSSLVLLSFWPLVGASTSTTSTPLFVAALAVKAENTMIQSIKSIVIKEVIFIKIKSGNFIVIYVFLNLKNLSFGKSYLSWHGIKIAFSEKQLILCSPYKFRVAIAAKRRALMVKPARL
jgi:hypothetical protein